MKKEPRKYLLDILISIESIEEYVGERKDFYQYQSNKQLKRAVEREIEIIGEAMNLLLKISPDIKVEHARKIVDTRNWVIHSYDNVDDYIIWGIVTLHLPKLKSEVAQLLDT